MRRADRRVSTPLDALSNEWRQLDGNWFDNSLEHDDEQVRHAALNAVSLNRDREAASQVVELLSRDSAANRRVAAEALGRIGDAAAVPHLLAAAAQADDRILQHSVTYALIELNEAEATRAGLVSRRAENRCCRARCA